MKIEGTMTLPAYKDIIELIKKGATVEAQEKIMELRETALGLQEENFAFRERIRELEDGLKMKQQLKFKKTTYWLIDGQTEDGPFCQRCYDVEHKLVRLQGSGTGWRCKACNNGYDRYDHC
jgi:tRNA(Ile2) C34 agmatinyltransferase TiaS